MVTTLDAVTIPKPGHKLSLVPAKEPTCTEDGNIEHYICTREGCGALFLDNAGTKGTTLDGVTLRAAHSLTPVDEVPSTCTVNGCKAHYQCSNCLKLFEDAAGQIETDPEKLKLPLAAHSLTLVPEKPATCTEDGHEAYYACANCQKLFADENATMALPQPNAIPAGEHAFGEGWESDDAQHWHVCECGERSGEAAHSFVTVVDRKPGETEPGEQHEECSVCGYRKAVVSIPAVGKIDLPQTGDSSHLTGWLALLGACCAGLLCLTRRRG